MKSVLYILKSLFQKTCFNFFCFEMHFSYDPENLFQKSCYKNSNPGILYLCGNSRKLVLEDSHKSKEVTFKEL